VSAPIQRTVTDTLHDLLSAADALRDMRLEAEVTVAAMEVRWAQQQAAFQARREEQA